MTLLHDSTDVLPPVAPAEASDEQDEPSTPVGLIVVLLLVLLAFAAAALLIAEAIARADVEQSIAADLRAGMSTPDTQHIGVSVDGSVLLQGMVNRYETVHVSMPNVPLAVGSADVTANFTGVTHDDRGVWLAERGTGLYSFGAAQATSTFIPDEARGKMQIGFRGADMTFDASVSSAGRSIPVSVAATPALQSGWMTTSLVQVSAAGASLSVDELRAKVGDEAVAALQIPPLCIAEGLPRGISPRSVTVRDQHLLLEVDIHLVMLETPEGRQPGACS